MALVHSEAEGGLSIPTEQADTAVLELIARLEAAEEGSRHLDRLVEIALRVGMTGGETGRVRLIHHHAGRDPEEHGDDGAYWLCADPGPAMKLVFAEPVTSSVDAALTLANRVVRRRGPIDLSICGSAQVVIHHNDPCGNALGAAFGSTPALALCIAIARATPSASQ